MAKAERRAADAATAAYMKNHPSQYPDSIMKQGRTGYGAGLRSMAKSMGHVPNIGRHFMIGMLGGVLADKIGYKSELVENFK